MNFSTLIGFIIIVVLTKTTWDLVGSLFDWTYEKFMKEDKYYFVSVVGTKGKSTRKHYISDVIETPGMYPNLETIQEWLLLTKGLNVEAIINIQLITEDDHNDYFKSTNLN